MVLNMKKIKKVIKILLSGLTALLIILSITVLIIGIKSNRSNKLPMIFGYTYSTVVTPSMEPDILVGDIVITKDYAYEDLVVNQDVIVFYSPSEKKYIVHKIIGVDGDGYYITKGIANELPDEEHVKKENYQGKVIKIIPKIGNLILDYRNILFGIIILIFIFIIISEIITIIKNINKDRRAKLEQELEEKYKEINKAELNQKNE